MTTKPYVSGSNYILKMSDFTKGDWCETWDALYWRFLYVNREAFIKNPRMSMMINLVNKMDKKKTIAMELGTTSISSSNWNEYESDSIVLLKEKQLMKENPHIVYGNARDHGFLKVSVNNAQLRAEWIYVKTNKEINDETILGKQLLFDKMMK